MKKIYSLGGSCWVKTDIPEKFKLDSMFKSFWADKPEIFLPLELFNGNLEREFLHNDGNWDIIRVNDTYDYRQILSRKEQDQNYVSNYLVVYQILNRNNGWRIVHPHMWKSNPTNKYTFKELFDNFNKNKHNLLFIIDFQRGGYENYTNQQLLEFERFLEANNYDLQDFIYLDVDNARNKNRFLNCKIPTFIQSANDPSGFGRLDNPNEFRNTRCFFANHMDYVNEKLGLV